MKKYWLPLSIGVVGLVLIVRSFRKPDSVIDAKGNVDTSGKGATDASSTKTVSYTHLTLPTKRIV